jgi:hypothetical protein
MELAFLSIQPAVLIIALCVAAVLLVFLIIDAHRHKKKRHKGRWK